MAVDGKGMEMHHINRRGLHRESQFPEFKRTGTSYTISNGSDIMKTVTIYGSNVTMSTSHTTLPMITFQIPGPTQTTLPANATSLARIPSPTISEAIITDMAPIVMKLLLAAFAVMIYIR
jgi:hypothetical protein